MLDNEKLAYDLALIYAKTKFESAMKRNVVGTLYPDNEPEKELEMLSEFFWHSYNHFLLTDQTKETL